MRISEQKVLQKTNNIDKIIVERVDVLHNISLVCARAISLRKTVNVIE